MPKGYIMGHITVNDPEAYKEFIARDTPVLASFGAKFIVRGRAATTPEGVTQDRHVIIEFPDYEAAQRAYNDPDYQEVAQIRRKTANSTIILVEGV